jgi:hypothetical protein
MNPNWRGALGPIRIRKTEQKNNKKRKTAVNYELNRKPKPIKPETFHISIYAPFKTAVDY